MYLEVDPGRPQPVVLVEPDDLQSFKVVAVARSWGELGRTLGDGGRVAPPHVWVDADFVRALATSTSDEWAAKFDAMLDFAGSKGWLDETGAVRAHCVWPHGEPEPE